jgi:hypothetical protein
MKTCIVVDVWETGLQWERLKIVLNHVSQIPVPRIDIPVKISRRLLPLVTVMFVLLIIATTASAAEKNRPAGSALLKLNKGDRIVFIGNTFADQLRLYGYLETLLTSRFAIWVGRGIR